MKPYAESLFITLFASLTTDVGEVSPTPFLDFTQKFGSKILYMSLSISLENFFNSLIGTSCNCKDFFSDFFFASYLQDTISILRKQRLHLNSLFQIHKFPYIFLDSAVQGFHSVGTDGYNHCD